MADNNEGSPFGNFSIQDTTEMGMGNRELIDGLFAETVTAESDDVSVIDKSKEKTPKTVTKETTKAPEKEIEDEEDPTKALKDLLESEEEEEEEEDTSTDKEKEPKEEPEQSENIFNTLSKELFNIGVFNKGEDEEEVEITTPEEFKERFLYEKQKGANDQLGAFLGQFGEDYQSAFQAIFVKGVNPKEYFGAYNKIEDFTSLDLTHEENQVAVIKQTLADQGLEQEAIDAEVERIKNYGDLDTVAERYHKVLIKKEATKLAQLEKESEQKLQQQQAYRAQYIKNVQTVLQDKIKNKEFDGIPLNPKIATEVQDFLLTDKYKTPTGETLTEFDKTILDLKRPENHERKVKVALLLKLLEKDPTLSTIQKAGITKKTDALFGELARQTKKTGVKKEQEKEKVKPSSWFS